MPMCDWSSDVCSSDLPQGWRQRVRHSDKQEWSHIHRCGLVCGCVHMHAHTHAHIHAHTRAGLTDTRQLSHCPPSCGSFREGARSSRDLTRGLPTPATQSVVLEARPEIYAPTGAVRSADSQAHPRLAAYFPEPGRDTASEQNSFPDQDL